MSKFTLYKETIQYTLAQLCPYLAREPVRCHQVATRQVAALQGIVQEPPTRHYSPPDGFFTDTHAGCIAWILSWLQTSFYHAFGVEDWMDPNLLPKVIWSQLSLLAPHTELYKDLYADAHRHYCVSWQMFHNDLVQMHSYQPNSQFEVVQLGYNVPLDSTTGDNGENSVQDIATTDIAHISGTSEPLEFRPVISEVISLPHEDPLDYETDVENYTRCQWFQTPSPEGAPENTIGESAEPSTQWPPEASDVPVGDGMVKAEHDLELPTDYGQESTIKKPEHDWELSTDCVQESTIKKPEYDWELPIDYVQESTIVKAKNDRKPLKDYAQESTVIKTEHDWEASIDCVQESTIVKIEHDRELPTECVQESSIEEKEHDWESPTDYVEESTIVKAKIDLEPPTDYVQESTVIKTEHDWEPPIDCVQESTIVKIEHVLKPPTDCVQGSTIVKAENDCVKEEMCDDCKKISLREWIKGAMEHALQYDNQDTVHIKPETEPVDVNNNNEADGLQIKREPGKLD